MSAAESSAALDRLADVARSHEDPADRAAHLFLVLGILGWQEPGVLEFLLDRADEQLANASAAGGA